MSRRARIAVVGAGIMGAAVAFRLAQNRFDVHLFEDAPGPAEGVTRHAFGWVNAINGDPDMWRAYELRLRAVSEYEALLLEMPELGAHVRRGSLVWKSSPEATASFAARHRDHASHKLITSRELARQEPRLKQPPALAIQSPQDLGISPVRVVGSFLSRAESVGATVHYGERVEQLRQSGQQVQGVQTHAGFLPFEVVVLAAGARLETLLEGTGISVDVQTSPVVLLRYGTRDMFLNHVISYPEVEVRQARNGTTLVVEDFYPGCDAESFSAPRRRVERALNEAFAISDALHFQGGAIGQRPVTPDGMPRCEFAQGVQGLYLLAGHPGVILAPLLGRLAAEEIAHFLA